MSIIKLCFSFLPFACGGPGPACPEVVHDQSFLNANWQFFDAGGTNVLPMTQTRGVGAGITGDAQQTIVPGFSPLTYQAEHYKVDQTWNPATCGAIDYLDWEIWFKVSGVSTYGVLKIVARQGDSYYVANSTYREPPIFSAFWQRASGSTPASDFVRFRGDGPGQLDFCPTAPAIRFGYMNFSPVFLSVTQVNYLASFWTTTFHRQADCNVTLVADECEDFGGGDFNADGMTSLVDWRFFQGCLSSPDQAPSPSDPRCVASCLVSFDADEDGDADLADYASFLAALEGSP